MSERHTSVAGSFYPSSCDEINRYISHFNQILDDSDFEHKIDFMPKALISPHAGYVYSGFTANAAFRTAAAKVNPKRVVVIGPSHRVYLDGATISLFDEYETPCGNFEIDTEYAQKLKDKFDFLHFYEEAHKEHSTETQFPFIKKYFSDVKVIEIVYGKADYEDISKIIETVLSDDGNLLVISTDLSHFYSQERANSLDSICLNAISRLDLNTFDQGCEACGIIGVKALVKYAQKHNLNSEIIDYRTSADASGDSSSVVGYTSAIIG